MTGSSKPLNLNELITLLDESSIVDDSPVGLIRIYWEFDDRSMSPEEAVDFVSVESAYYPEIGCYYSNEAAKWLAEQYVE